MEKRTAESPMDFEWQTRAPGDVTSPFYQLSMQHEKHKKRPHSMFDSPEKKEMPALREPKSQPFLFSQPQQPSRSSKPNYAQSAFMTPRKFDMDFSSGAETSPENAADNEETPEPPTKSGHRNSLFNMYGRFAPSPGRGEIPRMKHYSNALARRVEKRRRRDKVLDIQVRRDSDDESDRPSSSEGRLGNNNKRKTTGGEEKQSTSRISPFSDFFALLEAHPNVPSILSWWAQLVVNLCVFSLTVYLAFGFVSAIRAEIEQAADEVSDTILAEIETVCENWDRCMKRNPEKVGRAKVSAHTMAIIINSFIDTISWKAIVIAIVSISTFTIASNWSFHSFRNRLNQQEYAATHPAFHRQPSGQHNASAQLGFSQTPGFGYPSHAPSFDMKQDTPLMLEHSQPMDFVTARGRDRDSRMRTPSPAKRGRNLL
ncbi:hypothetical protein FE257_007931 [Aspergillus nanangensis]|uniref:Brl1/Brr6 domain-containing protein n=1 Tax=Aspergillus nanangensis TaxID=2582783 RepID=A0AAD4CXS8_ASPNN|nr:hypothetical protein FE257_007931 [Aspergillus nanangensis]